MINESVDWFSLLWFVLTFGILLLEKECYFLMMLNNLVKAACNVLLL